MGINPAYNILFMETYTKKLPMTNRETVQQEALNIASKNNRCGLGIAMGVGKTRIVIRHLIANFDPFIEVLVVVPKHTVSQSWKDELKKMEATDLLKHITFSTYLSINKQDPKYYDIVYLDECHSILPSHEAFLSQFNGKILGLTGTPPRDTKSIKGRLVQRYCPMKYTYGVDDATDSNILNNYKIIIHEPELSKLPTVKKKNKNGGHWYTSERKDYEYYNMRVAEAQSPKQVQLSRIMRMRALMDYGTKEAYVKSMLQNIDDKCIVFANTQKQADRISKYSYHSGNPKSEENLELFSDGRIHTLSCVMQLSEGVTIPNLKQGIIMHAYGNEKKTAQRIGRLLRLNPSETAICHILCYNHTQDKTWVSSALKSFDESKIQYYNPLNR